MRYRRANGPGERKIIHVRRKHKEVYGNQRNTKKRLGAKKSVSSASSKKEGRKKSRRPNSPGIVSRVKKVAREVLSGAVAGAATGAVVGAAEAGTKATGIGQPTKKTSKGKNRSAKK